MSLISCGCRAIVTALFFIAAAAPARAQVTNGDFNTGLEGWGLLSNGSSATFWFPHDAFFPFKLDSGSATIAAVTTPAGPPASAYFFTGAALPPATSYVFGGVVSVDRTSAGGTDVRFGVNWMTPSSTCFNAIIRNACELLDAGFGRGYAPDVTSGRLEYSIRSLRSRLGNRINRPSVNTIDNDRSLRSLFNPSAWTRTDTHRL